MEQIHQLEQAIQDITSEKKELQAQLEKLVSDYDRAKADYNRAQDIIHLSDSLETETVEALSLYRTKEKEAINELYRIVARYTDKLGGDRVKAEKATADILSTTLVQRTKLEKTISEKQQEIEKLSKQVSEKQKEIEGLKAEINRLSNSWWSEVPLNLNGDFSEGVKYWGAGSGGELRNARWGYEVVRNQYGEIWLDNPNIDNWPNAALAQGVVGLRSPETWYLKDKHFMLEADAMVVEDEPHDHRGWSRVAIVIMIRRIDGGNYNINGKVTPDLYTEYDIYRRNFQYYSYEDFISGNF
jgi:uncharacterized coiled-coil protein SlyX